MRSHEPRPSDDVLLIIIQHQPCGPKVELNVALAQENSRKPPQLDAHSNNQGEQWETRAVEEARRNNYAYEGPMFSLLCASRSDSPHLAWERGNAEQNLSPFRKRSSALGT
jgi:hypothetical protein